MKLCLMVAIGGGGGSRTRVSTECEEDIYILIPFLLLIVLGIANGQAMLQTIYP